jgi:hypothetical protein
MLTAAPRSSVRQKTKLAEPFLNAMRGFLWRQFGDIETQQVIAVFRQMLSFFA